MDVIISVAKIDFLPEATPESGLFLALIYWISIILWSIRTKRIIIRTE
jgi:hypothetical protein